MSDQQEKLIPEIQELSLNSELIYIKDSLDASSEISLLQQETVSDDDVLDLL